MNFAMLRNVQGAVTGLFKQLVTPNALQSNCSRAIHQICNQHSSALTSTINSQSILKPSSFLAPVMPLFNQVCGMKQKGVLQLRCKGCYRVSRQGRLYVMCSLKPRHKQMQMMKSFRNRQILTFAQQKKKREW